MWMKVKHAESSPQNDKKESGRWTSNGFFDSLI